MPFDCVGVIVRNQLFDHCNHGRDIFGGARHMCGQQVSKRTHIIQIPLCGFSRYVRNIAPTGRGTRIDFVVNVREIADIGHLICPIDLTQQAK